MANLWDQVRSGVSASFGGNNGYGLPQPGATQRVQSGEVFDYGTLNQPVTTQTAAPDLSRNMTPQQKVELFAALATSLSQGLGAIGNAQANRRTDVISPGGGVAGSQVPQYANAAFGIPRLRG